MTSKIKAISHHFPATLLTNTDLAAEFPNSSAEQIYRLSGVKQRYIAAPEETPSDLAYFAAKNLFHAEPSVQNNIDALLFVSEGLDYKAPATACILHQRLGLPQHCLSLDIPSGCTGFINGLQVAKSLIAGNASINNVLLLTAEAASKVVHPKDLNLRMLFSDAACATLITRSQTNGIGNFINGTAGNGAKALWVERSGFRHPVDKKWFEKNSGAPNSMQLGQMHMQGDEVLYFSLTKVPTLIADTLKINKVSDNDIRLYIFHQASKIILKSLQRKCRISESKFYYHYEDIGNTVSSTIPIALQHAIINKILVEGDKVMLVGFGIGFAWGATIIEV